MIVTLAVVLTVSVGLFFLRQRRQSQLSAYLGSRAEQLAGEGRWAAAAGYQARFLRFRPDDMAARLRLVEFTKEVVDEGANPTGFIRLLYETIGAVGDTAGAEAARLRAWLAEQLLATGQLPAAARQAQAVLNAGATPHRAAALRVAALARTYGVPGRGAVSDAELLERYGAVMPDLLSAIEANPKDVGLAVVAANLYRLYPLLADGDDAAELADRIVNRLVEREPGNADALVARHVYRRRHGVPGADEDLRAALLAAPNHYEANLRSGIAASLAGGDGARQAAEAHYRRAIAAAPGVEDAYLLLAGSLWSAGERRRARDVLEQAQSALPPTSLGVPFAAAEYLLADGHTEEAGPALDELRDRFESQLARVPAARRALLGNRLRLLEAQLQRQQASPLRALALFQAVALSPGPVGDPAADELAMRASRGAAGLFAELDQWDQAAKQLAGLADRLAAAIDAAGAERAVAPTPPAPVSKQDARAEYRRTRAQAAEAYLRAGQPARALAELEVLADDGGLVGAALQTRLEVELRVQLEAPPGERRWDEFRFLLDRAKAELPASERLLRTELRYLRILASAGGGDGRPNSPAARAESLLAAARKTLGGSAAYWRIAAQTLHGLGKQAEAETAARRYREVEDDPARAAELWVALLLDGRGVEQAEAWLASQIQAARDTPARARLRGLRVKLLQQAGDLNGAKREAIALAAEGGNRAALVAALELAIAVGDRDLARELEARAAAENVLPASELNYFRAMRALGDFQRLTARQKALLAERVEAVRTARPLWREGAVLAGRHAEAIGDTERAIQAYELAVSLGERRPTTLERLTLQLYRAARYDRAQQVIERLFATQQSVSLGVESLAISTAVQRRQLDDAARLAEESIHRRPDDPARRLWLYNVLVADDRAEQAGAVLAEAWGAFPNDAMVWNAQFAHHLRQGRAEAAARLLTELPDSIDSDPYRRRLTLAQGYRLLGREAEALRSYDAAIALKPLEVAVRLRYAELLLKSDPAGARRQLETVLEIEPSNGEARRKLAAMLAASGPGADWSRIDGLLTDAGDAQDQRIRAVLLTRRGRSIQERAEHCQLARRILQGLVEESAGRLEGVDRMLLAGAYEQEALLDRDPTLFESARQQLRRVITAPGATREQEASYLSFLFRAIGALAGMPDSGAVRGAFLTDARQRISQMRRELSARRPAAGPLVWQRLVGLEVRLLKAEDRPREAVTLLDRFGESAVKPEQDSATRARLILGLGSLYSLVGAHDRAEPWYRELTSLAPRARLLLSQSLIQQGRPADAVDLFLQGDSAELSPDSATALAAVVAASPGAAGYDRAWPAIAAALQRNAEDVDLLMSSAVLHVTRGAPEEAVRLFRKVVSIAPENVLALNNLATLLGEDQATRGEALTVIERAIKVAGRNAALLDTRGTIQLQDGQVDAAIRSLEESVVAVDVDPRYYFHLSAAYLRGRRIDQARGALAEARRRGIDTAVLTDADRALMHELEQRLGTPDPPSNRDS